MPTTISVAELMDKPYFSIVPVRAYRLPVADLKYYYSTFNPGESIGLVDAYLRRDGALWLSFLDGNKRPYYIKLSDAKPDLPALVIQGVKSEEQKYEDAKPKESLVDKLPRYAFIALTIAALAHIGGKAVSARSHF